MSKKNKKSPLAAAASRRLQNIGAPKMSPADVAHAMMHAEEDGRAERVSLEDGQWGWKITGPNGQPQILVPTPEILEALHHFEQHGHPQH